MKLCVSMFSKLRHDRPHQSGELDLRQRTQKRSYNHRRHGVKRDVLKLLSTVASDIGCSSFYTAPPPRLHIVLAWSPLQSNSGVVFTITSFLFAIGDSMIIVKILPQKTKF